MDISQIDDFEEVLAEEVAKNFPALRSVKDYNDLNRELDKTTRYVLQSLGANRTEYDYVRRFVVSEFNTQLDEALDQMYGIA